MMASFALQVRSDYEEKYQNLRLYSHEVDVATLVFTATGRAALTSFQAKDDVLPGWKNPDRAEKWFYLMIERFPHLVFPF